MSRYSLKQLLVATTLVAVGAGLLAMTLPPTSMSLACSGAIIGAGILTPVRHPWIGAVVGLILTPCVVFVYVAWRVYG